MRLTVVIDPGKHNIGVAEFHDGVLHKAWLAPTKNFISEQVGAHADRLKDAIRTHDVEVVIEKMQVYRGSVAAPLVELAIISSEIAGAMRYAFGATPFYYLPAQWKGQLDKPTCHDRARAALTAAEIARIELPKAKKTQLDVWDAVALGLAHLKKTGVRMGRSFAR